MIHAGILCILSALILIHGRQRCQSVKVVSLLRTGCCGLFCLRMALGIHTFRQHPHEAERLNQEFPILDAREFHGDGRIRLFDKLEARIGLTQSGEQHERILDIIAVQPHDKIVSAVRHLGDALAVAEIPELRNIQKRIDDLWHIAEAVDQFVDDVLAVCIRREGSNAAVHFHALMFVGVLSGIGERDRGLMEMASVFHVRRARRFLMIDLPGVYPYFHSACKTALGLSWKSGIAAEVIGMPRGSIGEHMQQAKVYLDTPSLFAWTVVIVLVSLLCERLVLHGMDLGMKTLRRWKG